MNKPKRTYEPQKLGKILDELVNQKNLKGGITKVKVHNAWDKIIGSSIQNYTDTVNYRGKTLFVQLNSAALREELSYGKDKLLKHLNEELGDAHVEKLVFR